MSANPTKERVQSSASGNKQAPYRVRELLAESRKGARLPTPKTC